MGRKIDFACMGCSLSACLALLLVGCTIPAEKSDGEGNQLADPTAGMAALPVAGAAAGTGVIDPTAVGQAGVAGSAAPIAGAAGTNAGTGGVAGSTVPTAGAGTSAAGGAAAGTTGDPGDGGVVVPEPIDYGVGDGSDVVTIGDSWMSIFTNGGGIEGALTRAGTSYRNYAVAGTTLLTGQIPGQYTSAKRSSASISTVIMTGGGNDIMFSGGCATPEACEMSVQALVDGLNELWTEMSNDGVKDVVYIRYSKNVGTTPSENRPMMAMTPPICLTGPIRCTSIPTDEEVGPGDSGDGIHPTRAACDRVAAKVLEVMEMKGIRR